MPESQSAAHWLRLVHRPAPVAGSVEERPGCNGSLLGTHEWQIVDKVAGESLSCWSLQASVVLGNLLDFGVSWGREISKVCILELTSCYGNMFQQVLKLWLPF